MFLKRKKTPKTVRYKPQVSDLWSTHSCEEIPQDRGKNHLKGADRPSVRVLSRLGIIGFISSPSGALEYKVFRRPLL
jgi:hypothetical protein